MTEEVVCVGVDVAKNTLDVAVSNLNETASLTTTMKASPVRSATLPD